MDDNLYKAPQSDLATPQLPGSATKAVIMGLAIEIVGTTLVGIAGVFVYTLILSAQGYAEDQVESALYSADPFSTWGAIMTFLGSIVSVIAGYVCARIARRSSYAPAVILATIMATLGAVVSLGTYSTMVMAFFVVITYVATLFGAWLFNRNLRTS